MKAIVKIEKEVDVKYCQLNVQPRYWEDATVNGVEDTDGTLLPCKSENMWKPLIDIDAGVIVNWEIGKTAKIHFKVCDEGSYYLLDEQNNVVLSIEEDYVPNKLIPGEYGDYIIMDIDENGKIDKWNPRLTDFMGDEE
jgi:hypothetical protein